MVLVSIPTYPTYNSVWSVGSYDQGIPIYNTNLASLGYQAMPDVPLINNLNGLQGYFFSKRSKKRSKKSKRSKKKLRSKK